MSTAEALLRLGLTVAGTIVGVWIGAWSWSKYSYRRHKREAQRLIAVFLGGTVVDETKPHRRTIIRKH